MSQTKVTTDLINTLDASKLTGTIPDAIVNVASIRSDILKLALHQAIDGNRVAYNLDDSFVDGFEDDTGITTETTVDRNVSGEYVGSFLAGDSNDKAVTFPAVSPQGLRFPGSAGMALPGDFTIEWWQNTTNAQTGSGVGVYGTTNQAVWTSDAFHVGYYNDNIVYGRQTGGNTYSFPLSSTGHDGAWHHLAFVRQSGTLRAYIDGVASTTTFSDATSIGNATFNIIIGANEPGGATPFIGTLDSFAITGSASYPNGTTFTPPATRVNGNLFTHHFDSYTPGFSSWTTYQSGNGAVTIIGSPSAFLSVAGRLGADSINETGTLISDPQTASTSRTSASGVIIYEDGAGTNTLGTDLKIYFSCDNSAWTEASSYGTATTYSGTKKLVKLGATTCTAGTSVAMKAVWANQSASKEARLHGWAVNY